MSIKIILQKYRRNKHFLRQTETERTHHQSISPVRIAKRSSLGRKEDDVGQKFGSTLKKKFITQGINKDKIKFFNFLILN